MLNEPLETYGLWAVFVVMLFKEMGIPLPVPADLIMLSVAAQTAQGRFPFALSFAVILVPMLIGGCVQFLFARGPGRRPRRA